MKKLIFSMIIAFAPAFLLAQNTPLSDLYTQFVSEPGFETTEILPGSMSLNWENALDNENIKEMMQKIESIRIMKYRAEAGNTDPEKLWKKMNKAAEDKQYTEVVTVYADNTQVHIYMIKGPVGITREVAMLEKDAKGIMMLSVTGNLDFSAMFSQENMRNLREMGEYFINQKGECKHQE